MAYSDTDELLAAALEQLGREQGVSPEESLIAHSMYDPASKYIPYTDTEEPHNMNPVLFVDEYGREIRGSRPHSKPGLHDPEAVKKGERLDDSNMIRYSTEDAIQDEVSNALYDELFKMARANSANPESKFIRDPGGSGKLIKFHTPIDLRSLEQKMGGHPFNQI
jgi:hypothetical protein